MSARWASSTSSASGRSSQKFATSQYSPCSIGQGEEADAGWCSPVTAPGSNSGVASAAAPESSSVRRAPRQTAWPSSCRTTPKANGRSSSDPRASATPIPVASAFARAPARSAVLPSPAEPST